MSITRIPKISVIVIALVLAVGCGGGEPGTTSGDVTHGNAIREFSAAIQKNPNDASAYYQRAYSYAELGEYSAAIDDYTKAI